VHIKLSILNKSCVWELQVKLNNTTVKTLYDNCSSFNSPETVGQLRLLYGEKSVVLGVSSLTLRGIHGDTAPLYDYHNKDRGVHLSSAGAVLLESMGSLIGHHMICKNTLV
jgi:hypothetical protein